MAHIFVISVLLVALSVIILAMPTTPISNNNKLTTSIINQEPDREMMNTANTMYYNFRPVYSYRRVQSQRRRVYVPRRRYSYGYDKDDRFPTVA